MVKIQLSAKLILTHLGMGIIPLVLIALILRMVASNGLEAVGEQGATALETAAYDQLKSMRAIKEEQITVFFQTLEGQLSVVKENPWTLQTLEAFSRAADDSVDSASWRALAKKHDQRFTSLSANLNWHDIFLINSDGKIVYTLLKEQDLGNFVDREPLKSSSLGKAYAKLRANPGIDFAFGDFAPYRPSGNKPAAFLISGIRDSNAEVVAHVALQISTESIRNLMATGSDKKRALEAYLVGPDGYMRSDSILNPEDYSIAASFIQGNQVYTQASRSALSGNTDTRIIEDYRGYTVLSAWAPVEIFDTRWALLCEIDAKEAMQAKTLMEETSAGADRQLLVWAINVLIISGVMVSLGAWFIARSISRPITRAAKIAGVIASGDLDQRLNSQRSDEIGQLSQALDGMVEALSRSFWHKTGVAELAARMRGGQDISVLAQNIVTFLAKYLNAQMASLYLADKTQESLILTGGYAFNKRKSLNECIKVGEGLAGQAAREKSSISVTDLPADYLRISSTLGDSAPCNILAVPLVYADKLAGVIEFASFREFSDNEMAFVDDVAEGIAIAFNTAQRRQEVQRLLTHTQQQSDELESRATALQSQQEELRSSNEELEQQSEELRVSNEELEHQGEELRVSNEELEEKTQALEQQKAEIEKRTNEVEAARRDLETKARELELASKYKSEFLANMSHELRTPLNSMLILAKILTGNDDGNLTEEQVESARIIYSGGQDLLLLINEILDLSKVEAGMMEVHREEVELNAIVDNLQQQFLAGAEEKNLAFTITLAPDAPSSITTDGQRLEQILKNFLANAFKFTAQGSVRLDIGLPSEDTRFVCQHLTRDNTLALSVHDTGSGIPDDKQQAIFEAFKQADGSTSRRFGGTGLGLSIARSLAHLLNGEIQIESAVGAGSTFTLFLPLERRGKTQETPIPRLGQHSVPQRRAVGPERPQLSSTLAPEFLPDDRQAIKEGDWSVLIIEDDPQFADILMGQARKRGFKCLAAGDGGSGLQLANDYQPSSIILDLGLPDIDGTKVLDSLKFDLKTRHIPVHVMSARDQEMDIMRKGVVGYLTKPVDAEEINAVLGKIEDLIDGSSRNILVIEDDENNRKAIVALLATKGVEITDVGSAKEALKLIPEGNFDCVILDIGLPDISGFELLRRLDADPAITLPPIIIYTGKQISAEEQHELTRYTTSVIIKGANSPERLLDETSLFLHMLESSLPQTHRQTLRMLHDPEQLLQGRKVLLVDDDLRNSFALSKLLRKAGLTVIMAENGQVALDTLNKDNAIELVLMDIMMPVMDGYETIARIRAQACFKELPIVALTAKAMVEDRAKCIQAGANDYLAKPVDTEKLISLMRVLLSP